MKSILLNGKWELFYYSRKEHIYNSPEQLKLSALKPIEAKVPGNVELDLIEHGIIPKDIFKGKQITCLKEYEWYDWWYIKEFKIPDYMVGKTIRLNFHGVDCIAEYWINNNYIGKSDNMMIEHQLDITEYADFQQNNQIAVHIISPASYAMEKEFYPSIRANGPLNYWGLWLRKAPHSFGWDIMPRALSAGLWRGVELAAYEKCRINDMYFYTISANLEKAKIGVYYTLNLTAEIMDKLKLRINGTCGNSFFDITQNIYFKAGDAYIEVNQPELWWPTGYGEANLYEVRAELIHNHKVIDSMKLNFGIRTAELNRTENTSIENPGEFLFKINEVPIFCKGSNWISLDPFHSKDAEKYRKVLELFSDSGCNMIRCWGGNVYEDHAFFDYCDQHGIMVWQEFAMACASYPQEKEFLKTIHNEAASVIKKLRNHASLVLWCGDNECDNNYVKRSGFNPTMNLINRNLLPQVVFKYDPYRPYIQSSPYYTMLAFEKGDQQLLPERHLYGARDYYKSKFYTDCTAHFIGEIGFHGAPCLSTIRKFLDEEYIWPWQDNEQWIFHGTETLGKTGKRAYRIRLMAEQIHEMFGENPDNINDFILASQISQAEANKFFIENTRLKKWRKTGILWWNMIDGWPQFSDSVVDYYFRKKLAYYYIKRVQQPVCIMMDEPEDWFIRVIAGNDSNNAVRGTFRIWEADTLAERMSGDFFASSNSNCEIGQIRVSHGEQKMFLIEWIINDKRYGNHYLHGYPPFSYKQYRKWMQDISMLPDEFDAFANTSERNDTYNA